MSRPPERGGAGGPANAPLRVLIVDDEALARTRLGHLVRDGAAAGGVLAEVVGELDTADAAVRWLHEHDADVLLLDIAMPGTSGMALAARLRTDARAPTVIFVTAHAGHAVQAFELEALDYLTKPVRRDRLQAALQKVQRRTASAAAPAHAPVIVVSERGGVLRVPLSDVLYLRAELKYVTLRTAQRSHVLDDALSDIEHRLGDRFLRVHRNAIVAKAAVRRLERHAPAGDGPDAWAVLIHPTGEWLTVSRRQMPAVRDALLAGGV